MAERSCNAMDEKSVWFTDTKEEENQRSHMRSRDGEHGTASDDGGFGVKQQSDLLDTYDALWILDGMHKAPQHADAN